MAGDGDRVAEQVQAWRDDLIDLSRRNRLLNATGSRQGTMRILEPNIEGLLARLGTEGRASSTAQSWRFHYPPSPDLATADATVLAALSAEDSDINEGRDDDELLTDVPSAIDLSKRLRALHRRATSEYMDKGLRVLYLGLGVLRWSEVEDEWLESPLIMQPVVLMRTSPREPFRLVATDDDVVMNPALMVKLETSFGITIPDVEDASSLSSTLNAIQRSVADIEGWEVRDQALFGAFSFQKEAMYRDLLRNEAAVVSNPLVRAIAGDTGDLGLLFDPVPEDELDEVAPPEELAAILDCDSTQRACIVAARDGRSFVMDGPPGTGKSQTIANVIAELLAANKTVLFVSEKAAALDVVYKRLSEAHLNHYILELHSAKATRKEFARALGDEIGQRPRAAREVSADGRRRAVDRRRRLSAFAAAQNEVRQPFGRTLHWAIGRRAQLEGAVEAPPPEVVRIDFSSEQYAEALDHAQTLGDSWGPVENAATFIWRDVVDPNEMRARRNQVSVDLASAIAGLESVADLAKSTATALRLDTATTVQQLNDLEATLQLLDHRQAIPPGWLATPDASRRNELIEVGRDQSGRWAEAQQALDARAPGWRTLPSHVPSTTLDAIGAALRLDPALDPSALTQQSLQNMCGLMAWLATEGDALAQAGHDLEGGLGLQLDASPAALVATAEVAMLGLAPDRPEEAWLDSVGLDAARRAVAMLRPLVENYRSLAAQLSSVFNPAAFQLDVEALYTSPGDVAPDIGRLSGAGRANRRKLKACSGSGKIDDAVIAALPALRQWHALARQLAATESTAATALGPTYYQSGATDFDRVTQAIDVAQRALEVLGVAQPPDLLRSQLGRTSVTAEHIAAQGTAVAQRADQWWTTLAQYSALLPQQLASLPCDDVATWARAAEPILRAAQQAFADAGDTAALLTSVADLSAVCRDIGTFTSVEQWFDASSAELAEELGGLFDGPSTDWDALHQASVWASQVVDRLGASTTGPAALALLHTPLPTSEYEQARRSATKRLTNVADWFAGAQHQAMEADLSGRIDDAVELLQDLRDNLAQLDEWAAYNTALNRLRQMGLGGTIDALIDRGSDRLELVPAVERAMLTSWIDAVLAEDDRCEPVRADDHDRMVREFQELDHLLVAHATSRVINAANQRRPATVAGEFGLIRTEAEKKTRHRPIKQLLSEAGRAALALKPCFMMSPLSVSQYLPADLTFDAVIFDEASQVRPGDAIGSIYRGRQLIIAGDNKQLPPTAFFDRNSDDGGDEYDVDDLAVFESLLDLSRGAASIPELPLRWHYRSRHESLITYSNRAFYGGKLITFPAADESGPAVGVELFHVPDGTYHRGTSRDNPIEAKRVVERVVFHATHHSDLTLGVVAFSEAQATRIQFELEAVQRERSDLDHFFQDDRLDGFFIKNLESVQGDERDIIIFSIGYGPDESGKLTMHFGPINRDGGQRRLNVAVTRARRRLEVVSSITASDIRESVSPGVSHLKGYLDFAERGEAALPRITVEGGEPESPFEEDVLDLISGWGFDAVPQVGHAGYRLDIGIRDPSQPGRWLLGVECDGAAYHSSRTARDRDRLRQQVLEGLGWRIHRIWGPSWYRDRRSCEARLREAINNALHGEAATPVLAAQRVAVEVDEVDWDGSPPDWAEIYNTAAIAAPPRNLLFSDTTSQPVLMEQVIEVVVTEGPVHTDVLVDRLKQPWGVGRARSRFRDAVQTAVDSLVAQREIAVDGLFLVRYGAALPAARLPDESNPSTARSIDRVPPVELQLAIRGVVSDAHGIDQVELTQRVARLFGWRRTSQPITQAIDQQIAALVRQGFVDRSGTGKVTPR